MDPREMLRYHEDLDLFRDALSFSQSQTGFAARLIEKDYYCSAILEDMAAGGAGDLAFPA